MQSAARTYLENKVMTATTEQLQLMLYEGAIRFARQMKAGLAERDFERAQISYEKVDAILCELYSGLRPEREPALTEKFGALYNFCQRRLDESLIRHDIAYADDALRILEHLRATWLLVMEQIGNQEKTVVIEIPQEAYEPLAINA